VVAVHRRQQQHGAGEKEPEPRQPVTLHLKVNQEICHGILRVWKNPTLFCIAQPANFSAFRN
jgi:hypothetical protein